MMNSIPNQVRRTAFLLLFALALLVTVSLLSGSASVAAGDQNASDRHDLFVPLVANQPTMTDCRYGVNNRPGLPGNQWMTVLGVGHYINFAVRPQGQPVPETVQLLPQIRLQQDRKDGVYLPSYTIRPPLTMDPGGLGQIIRDNPGHVWMVGNEPDVANVVQDNIYPQWYARAYHEVYHFIKELDPYAHVAIGGLSMMTPGRLQYLDIVWDTYLREFGTPMPVDVWNMHLYILPEIRPSDGGPSDGKIALGTDPGIAKRAPDGPAHVECPKDEVYCRAEHDSIDIFKKQIVAMRTWMKKHGQQNRPLLLSEFSLLYPFVDYDNVVNPTQCFLMDEFGQCFTPNRVTAYMNKTLDYLETARDPVLGYPADNYHLVQQWAWYSMITGEEMTGGSSNLLQQNYEEYAPDAINALTQAGHTYRARVYTDETTLNLVAGEAVETTVQAGPSGTADVPLRFGFLNNGTGLVLQPFHVAFYENAALTKMIAEVQIEPGVTGLINGCAWGRVTEWTKATWVGAPVGTLQYWVKVDSRNEIRGETNEADNVISGTVNVVP